MLVLAVIALCLATIWPGISQVRERAGKPLWITEYGWSSGCGSGAAVACSDAVQASGRHGTQRCCSSSAGSSASCSSCSKIPATSRTTTA